MEVGNSNEAQTMQREMILKMQNIDQSKSVNRKDLQQMQLYKSVSDAWRVSWLYITRY